MAVDTFFSPHWYRVAGLRPRLLQQVRVERHRYQGQAWYALHDPVSSRVHRVTTAAYLFIARMDGRATVDGIWNGLVAELDNEAPGQHQVLDLLMQLHGADLLKADMTPDALELLQRHDRLSRSVWSRNLRNPLSMQFPLIDPDRFLSRTFRFVRPLLGWKGLILWLLLVASALLAVGQHWAELSSDVLDRLLQGQGLLPLLLCYPAVKALHELGHGYMAKKFGCEIREMGLMLLVLFPVPYVDASNSAALRGKWSRAAVAAAGIFVETALAAIAALVWVSVEPGITRAVAFDVMVLGGVSTLLVNGNPLLRFDGYYVLLDLIEVPNLGQRATRYLGHLVSRYVFGVRAMQDFPATGMERFWMLVYAPAAWAYRMSVLVAISMFVASHYFIAGVIAALLSVCNGVVLPAVKALWRVATAPHYRQRRLRATGITFGVLAGAVIALLTVPAPVHSTTQGVVWMPEDAFVRARTDGFVQRVAAVPGAAVHGGDALLVLDAPLLTARIGVTAARVDELRQRLQAEWVDDRIKAAVTRFELAHEEATLARERSRQSKLSIAAAAAGVFHTVRPAADLPGRYFKEGEIIGYVTPAAGRIARIIVPQADIGLVHENLRAVHVRLGDRISDFASSVVRSLPGGRDDVPSAALTSGSGGDVVADPRDSKGLKAFERHFQFDLSVPDSAADIGFGSRVYVRFDYDWQPLGVLLYWRARQAFLTQFEA